MFRSHFKDKIDPRTARVEYLFDLFNAPAAREAAYATMVSMQDTRPLLASIPRVTAPTLVAWGREDRSQTLEQGRRLARELRGARFEVFECGHSPQEECPEAFVETVSLFLVGKKAA
jgi:2-hydroxy-6-oxonona-2,4-dienedioate hydrolase